MTAHLNKILYLISIYFYSNRIITYILRIIPSFINIRIINLLMEMLLSLTLLVSLLRVYCFLSKALIMALGPSIDLTSFIMKCSHFKTRYCITKILGIRFRFHFYFHLKELFMYRQTPRARVNLLSNS